MCVLLQACKVVQPHQGLLELKQQGLVVRNPDMPSPAVRGTQTCVVPFWKVDHLHIFVRAHCPLLGVMSPHCICAVIGYIPVLLKYSTLSLQLCLHCYCMSVCKLFNTNCTDMDIPEG